MPPAISQQTRSFEIWLVFLSGDRLRHHWSYDDVDHLSTFMMRILRLAVEMSACGETSQYFDAPIMHFFTRGSDDDDKGNVDDLGPSTSSYQQGYPRHPELNIPGNLPYEQQGGEPTKGNDQGNSRSPNKRTSRKYALQPTSPVHGRRPGNDAVPENVADGNVQAHPEEAKHHTPSLRSLPESTGGKDRDERPLAKGSILSREGTIGRRVSVRTTRTTASIFNGSALAGPNAVPEVDEGIYWRGSSAEKVLSKKEKEKILKEESKSPDPGGLILIRGNFPMHTGKEAKRLSKLMDVEATTEKVALNSALNMLGSLQELQKAAIKREAKAELAHSRALAEAQKAESKYHEARARAAEERARAEARVSEEQVKLEGKQAEVKAQEERVEAERQLVKELEEHVAECARGLERLRIIKATDEVCDCRLGNFSLTPFLQRERRVKMMELRGGTPVL